MRPLLTILFLFLVTMGRGQVISATQSSLNAAISAQAAQSLQVDLLVPQSVDFITSTDYNTGKSYGNYFGVRVKSTVPWLLSVKAISPFSSPNNSMPSEILNLQSNINGNGWIPISQNTSTLLRYWNRMITNYVTVAAKFNPGWKYAGGSYNTTVLFTLTPE